MDKIYGFKTEADMRRVVRAVKRVESAGIGGRDGGRWDCNSGVIMAKITGNDGAAVASRKYAWSQVRMTASAYEVEGISGTTTKGYATAPNGGSSATNDIVTLVRIALNNGDGTFDLTWVITNPKTGLNLQTNGTTVVTGATALNAVTNAGIIIDASSNIGLIAGASGTPYTTLVWNGTWWTVDFIRAHS